MTQTALILLGHGSHISPMTAGVVWDQVDYLRSIGTADEVTAAFWKEQPSFHQVLGTVQAEDITLVPLFTADGYFTQTVIPAEMGLTGTVTIHDWRTIRYAPSLANHDHVGQILRHRAEEMLQRYALPPNKTAIAIVGHGTSRNSASRDAARHQAEALGQLNLAGEVVAAYLDDTPSIPDLYTLTQNPHLVVIPYFLAQGSHTAYDVPSELGLALGQTEAVINGRQVYYAAPLGTDGGLSQMILDLAHRVGMPSKGHAVHPWGGFPQVGASQLLNEVQKSSGMMLGQLWLSPERVCHVEDRARQDLSLIETPQTLRQLVRGADAFRPLSTQTTLPKGWQVQIPSDDVMRVAAVVETIYPAVLASRVAPLPLVPLHSLAQRQTGMYAQLGELSPEAQADHVAQICSQCVLHPAWHDGHIPDGKLSCSEACNWWMSHALMQEESE